MAIRKFVFLLALFPSLALAQQTYPNVKQPVYNGTGTGFSEPSTGSTQVCNYTDNVRTWTSACPAGSVTAIVPGTNVTCSTNVAGQCTGTVTINSTATGTYQPTPFSFPPATSGFSWLNQGSSSVRTTNSVESMKPLYNVTAQWSILYKSNDYSTPYGISAGFNAFLSNSNSFQAVGLWLTDGTKLIGIQCYQQSGVQGITIERWTNATTFSATQLAATAAGTIGVTPVTQGTCYTRWRNDGTTLYADISLDGLAWQNIYTEAVGAFLTPTGYGWGLRNSGNSAATSFGTLLGWNPVNNATL